MCRRHWKSMMGPPGVQYENALLQIAPVDKSKCPYVKDNTDVGFQLFTRHNPTTYQELQLGDDETLFASNMDFHDKTVVYFHAWMEQPDDGSGIMVREAYMQRGDSNVIMVDAHHLEAGPWYFTAAQNTWYIGRFAALFIDYLASRGLNLNNTHLIGHSLGAHAAGVAGSAIKSGRVARITGLDPALPLFDNLPLEQRLDTTDAHFVDIIHTDAGIFGYKAPMGHVDFYPNGGISPQPGCELEVVLPKQLLLNKFFCSHWRSYMFYTESVLRPMSFVASECGSWKDYKHGRCSGARTQRMGYGLDTKRTQTRGFYSYYLTANQDSHPKRKTLESKLENLFAYIHAVKMKNGKDFQKKENLTNVDKLNVDLYRENNTNSTIKSNINKTSEVVIEEDGEFSNKSNGTWNDSIKDVIAKQDEDKIDDYVEDQIAEASEYDIAEVEYNQDELKNKETVSLIKNSEEVMLEDDKISINKENFTNNNKGKEILPNDNKLFNNSQDISSEVKQILDKENENEKRTIKNEKLKNTQNQDMTIFTLFDVDFESIKNEYGTNKNKQTDKRKSEVTYLNYKDPCEPKKVQYTENIQTDNYEVTKILAKENKPKEDDANKPKQINIFNILGTTYRISQVISTLKDSKKTVKDKIKKLFNGDKTETATPSLMRNAFLNRDSESTNHVVKRQKRFLPFFKRSEEGESNNILFKMLDFLVKNRKNVLPVFTVMREINTLVKSGNGELNHFTKEQNNYIGATPPVFTPITYNLELGNENRAVAFVKRLLGMSPKGDRLTISGRK